MLCRRNRLQDVGKTNGATNLGLWADRYLRQQKTGNEAPASFKDLIRECSEIGQAAEYPRFFNRWRVSLEALGAKPREATVTYRLAAGHGRESVMETGIIFHHTYGVPIIPGSSLKGAAASYARRRLDGWGKKDDPHREMFGDTDISGYVTFFDALPLPGTGKWELRPDVLTVHHRDYYGGNQPPADWDDPNPVSFMSVTGTFLIALTVPGSDQDDWQDAAYDILGKALAEEGVGGKTSSGYGRLDLPKGKP